MKILLYLLFSVLAYGCAAKAPNSTSLLHESAESALLTEEEFMVRASRSATIIYEGLKAVDDAINQYVFDHNGEFPSGNAGQIKALLLEQGYLEEWPVVPAFAHAAPVQWAPRYYNNHEDADGNGLEDRIIFVQKLKLEVCEEFVRRYASPGFGDTVYDFQAAGKRYPGQVIGKHIKIYAIDWSSGDFSEDCDIYWVVQYRERVSQPRRK